ncbi:efflux transporter outer membrane subunit [Roseateles saccharophilus]|uniref:NodT family efflux transporter outer membrane factor (OMF) lipoprotein n=1 Tax=Roseateles saccharophilus TaxID=304 RepID=A0A4R3UQI6_ROSSA|nr:efflux transporter outer membrane subunit [Roseateles saccharophilus]MDG0833685.1 efflux transporter outer membrane subunit [Roseateles saccharophilus]TCU93272.1 NodT family efflux transporter outer membrane factor (OMF) lipoprotein [Roseateles saccharophilus]
MKFRDKHLPKPLLRAVQLFAVAALSGCAAGPDFHAPPPPQATGYLRGEPRDTAVVPGDAAAPQPRWWTAYGSARLDALVERALQRNPGIAAGEASLRQAQENVNAQRGLFYPSAQLGYSATRQNSGTVLSSPLSSGQSLYNLHTAQLSVGFVPDVFGSNRRQVESLQAGADSQRYQTDAVRTTIASNVAAAVLQEQSLLDQVQLVNEALGVAKEQLRHSRAQQEAGYSSGLDLAQQEAALAQTQALLPPLNKQLEQTRDLLSTLCGDLPSEFAATDDESAAGYLDRLQMPQPLPRVLPSQLVQYRPDVQAALEQLHAAYAQIGVSVSNMLPQFSIGANLGYSAASLSSLISPAHQSWGLVAGLTQPLFAGGALTARKHAAEAAAEAAQAQYRSAVLTAFQNVADTLYALEHDGQALDAAQRSVAAAERLMALTEQQFSQGYAARPAWLAARQALLQARLARAGAKATHLGDSVALFQALGGGWRQGAQALAGQAAEGH